MKLTIKKRNMYLVAADKLERRADTELKNNQAAKAFALQLVNKYLTLAGV
jgi:hypothetical protein